MPTELETAVAFHREGRLQQAAKTYQSILEREPENADAMHLLGVVFLQTRHPRHAIQLIVHAISLKPKTATFHCNLGEAYRTLGQFERAIDSYREALRIEGQYPEAYNNLGLALQGLKQWDRAAPYFRAALQVNAYYALALNNLGVSLREMGDLAGAREKFAEALAIHPSMAQAYSNLSQLDMETGDFEAAVRQARDAVRLGPDVAEAHNNLGHALRKLGQHEEARAAFEAALRIDPDFVRTIVNLGIMARELGQPEEALKHLRRAAQLEPDEAQHHANLADVLEEQEQMNAAISAYERALACAPERADLHNFYGHALQQESRYQEARDQFLEALRIHPEYAGAHCNLGSLLEVTGQLDDARRSLLEAIRLSPKYAAAWAQLATLERDKLSDEDLARLEALLADPELQEQQRLRLEFGLAQVLDARRDFERAANFLRDANALASKQSERLRLTYDPAKHALFAQEVRNSFTSNFFERVAGWGDPSERPVFVFGLPRSGTTLVEQVLASHSQVFGAGERNFCRQAFDGLPKLLKRGESPCDSLRYLTRDAVRESARRHLEKLTRLDDGALRVVDKMPDNYLYLGLIAMQFPKARLIHCRRDLRDIAVSCWMTNFRNIRWANDPEHIVSRFQEYERLMDHWRKILPIPILEVRYEDTVADLESVARQLIAWVGLEWEPACLEFHRTQRPVKTASVLQVRQPIYTSSVERWRNYERVLGEFFDKLPEDSGPTSDRGRVAE